MASCAGTKAPQDTGGQITKVKYLVIDHTKRVQTAPQADFAIPFESQHYLHGAVSNKERTEREGNYYTIFWRVDDRSQPVKVRLEYRQKLTGFAVKSIEKEVTDIRRNNVTDFSIIGEDYITNGAVNCWKASLVRGKEVLAEHKSYLWEKK